MHSLSDVRQIEIHSTEPIMPDSSPFEVEFAIIKLKKYELPGSDQILAELIQVTRQCGILNISQLYRPPWPVMGIGLIFYFYACD
jgi:hypothetical protein